MKSKLPTKEEAMQIWELNQIMDSIWKHRPIPYIHHYINEQITLKNSNKEWFLVRQEPEYSEGCRFPPYRTNIYETMKLVGFEELNLILDGILLEVL